MKFVNKIVLGMIVIASSISVTFFMKKSPLDIQNQTNAQKPTSWKLILVNKTHPIPDNYKVTLQELSNGQAVDERIYPELQEMFDAARSQGVYPEIVSSYRTAKDQAKIMQNKIIEFQDQGLSYRKAKVKAEKSVATSGTSEHELGLAVDINSDPNYDSSDKAVYNWLARNAYQYGFILRYPSNKIKITGVDYEPWHYRYVGKKAAKEIFKASITLEEYLKQKTTHPWHF